MMAATHDGHRKRMRERFRISGLEGFSEHEVLELILFYGRARGNVNDTAHALMDVFGSLPRVLEASPEQLMLIDGIGEESATLLSLILPLFRRYSDEVNQVRSKLESRQVTLDYCRTMMAGYRREQFYVICLTADGSIICNRKVTEGTLSAVTAYPRLVLEAALNSNAHSVVLCHNHPGGVALPSEDDICTTRYLQQLMEGVRMVEQLRDGDKVLIAEGCTHRRQCDDIGTVKIPNWLRTHTGCKLDIETCSGSSFPADLSPYAMVIHCGGCTLHEKEMKHRIFMAKEQKVPIVNYGIFIAYINGIVQRSTELFRDK